jgi:hypothetical protein
MEGHTSDYEFKEEAIPFVVFNPELQGNILIRSS